MNPMVESVKKHQQKNKSKNPRIDFYVFLETMLKFLQRHINSLVFPCIFSHLEIKKHQLVKEVQKSESQKTYGCFQK